ncbi:MAG: hypothetical protein L0154_10180 [Chloroflexi bacterium]|nr:hypothetical protein [Chloroflexota bacterium]
MSNFSTALQYVYEIGNDEPLYVVSTPDKDPTAPAGYLGALFTSDGKYVVHWNPFTHSFQVVDLSSGAVETYIGYSSDPQRLLSPVDYFINRPERLHFQLIEISTGRVIREEYSRLVDFSRGGSLIQIYDPEANHVEFADVETGQTIYEMDIEHPDALWNVFIIDNDQYIHYYDSQDNQTKIVEVASGEIIESIDGLADMRSYSHRYVSVYQGWETARENLYDRETQQIIARADQFIPVNEDYAYVTDGLVIDVYGSVCAKLDTMLPPRADKGIGVSENLEIRASRDETSELLTSESRRFYIIGQFNEWVFGHIFYFDEDRWVFGWVKADTLEVIDPWDNVPILGTEDPLEDFYALGQR